MSYSFFRAIPGTGACSSGPSGFRRFQAIRLKSLTLKKNRNYTEILYFLDKYGELGFAAGGVRGANRLRRKVPGPFVHVQHRSVSDMNKIEFGEIRGYPPV